MSEKSVVYDSTEKQYSVRRYWKTQLVHDSTKNTM
jgi:hypothetical protein